MLDVLWWIQAVGGVLTIIVVSGVVVAGIYSSARETPVFWRRLTGAKAIEDKFDNRFGSLRADHLLSQELQLQQAEAFNELSEVVCDEHNIPDVERPSKMDTTTIRTELMGRQDTDFTRGGD